MEPPLLLRRHFDVGRRQEEDLIGDAVHLAAEPVGEPAREVDDPAGEIAVDVLKVDDHGLRHLQLVADLLGVVEADGSHDVHACALYRRDRPHHRRAGLQCDARLGLTRDRADAARCRLGLETRWRATAAGVPGRHRLLAHAVVLLVLLVVDETEVHHRPSPHGCHAVTPEPSSTPRTDSDRLTRTPDVRTSL